MATNISNDVRHEVLRRSGGYCEARIPGYCKGIGEHMHHRQMRSQGGKDTAQNLIHLCFQCHNYTHGHPRFSYEVGLLLHGWDDVLIEPTEVRYKVREGKLRA